MKRWISVAQLTDELLRRKLIKDASTAPEPGNERPWYISIVLGCSGWLAGLFALACVALFFKPDTPVGFALAGLILLSTAFGLYAADRSGAFLDQLALAFSIAGQLALAWAAGDAFKSDAATAALVAVMQIVLLLVMPNALAKVLAALFACCAWALAIRFAWWGASDFYVMRRQITLAPALLTWLVIWTPIIAVVYGLIRTERAWMASGLRRIARPALNGLLVSLALATWLSEPSTSFLPWGGDTQVRTNWFSLWPLLGAASALYAALCAFQLRSRAMIGVSIAGALLHVAQFYYLLGTTLLMKSVIMLGVGVAALAAAYQLNDRNVQNEPDAS